MTEASTVSYEIDDCIAIVTIELPEARYAVNRPTDQALAAAFCRFDSDASRSVAILTGRGGAFCAGADLKQIAAGRRDHRVESGDAPMGAHSPQIIKAGDCRDRRSGGEADDRTCHRADRAKHDRARHRTESRIARALLRSRFERGEQRARDQCSNQKHPHGKSPANHAPMGLRKCGGRKDDEALELHEKARFRHRMRAFWFIRWYQGGSDLPDVSTCPTCQLARAISTATPNVAV